MNRNSNENGEIITISLIFVGIIVAIGMFVLAIFMSHINTILYNLKIDMYSLNKSAVVSVNKYKTSIDDFSYNQRAYKDVFMNGLKANYDLNDELENKDKLINKIEVIEYTIYEANKKDSYTKKRVNDRVIHTVLKVRITPIILKCFLEDIFVFTIHEDVALNSMKTSL